MSPTLLRTSYTISAPILQRFNAAVPAGERSRVMEQYMEQALFIQEKKLGEIADIYMTDATFQECRNDGALWDATIGDGLPK